MKENFAGPRHCLNGDADDVEIGDDSKKYAQLDTSLLFLLLTFLLITRKYARPGMAEGTAATLGSWLLRFIGPNPLL